MQVLDEQVWRELANTHAAQVNQLTADRRSRQIEGRRHPVDDFLWEYYNFRPTQLARWHPGVGVALAGAAQERADWSYYAGSADQAFVDVGAFVQRRGRTVTFVLDLLRRTLSRPGRFGCFGLHEWAMVYRADDEAIRHGGWPLRLGSTGTDDVVESHTLSCTHFDAYRFFTPAALPRNSLMPTREDQLHLEQPGCLHAGMDLYKWSFKLTPAMPSAVTLQAFELARDIRELDMRASPYDLRSLGYEPVLIETPEGKSEYVEAQRGFTLRANDLRTALITVLEGLEGPGNHANR